MLVVAAESAAAIPSQAVPQTPDGFLVTNAVIVDGTGAPRRYGAVRVTGSRIAAVGDLTPAAGEKVIDARGLVLAPGFIDTHSHHDRGLADRPDALAAVSQGITTIVVGQDGGSQVPLSEFFLVLERSPPALNVASYVGHGTLRRMVMGDDYRRHASRGETDSMGALLRRELAAGALGLSTGLEYDPGIYASTGEVLTLARETAAAGGRYISHLRSEDRGLWQAVDEIIRIGREARLPVQISHLKLAMKSLWGDADRLLARLDAARAEGVDITADVYPYTFWQSTMTVLFPDRDFDNRETAAFALAELAPPEGMLIAAFGPDSSYVGKTLAEIAVLRDRDPVTTYMDLIAEARAWEQTHQGDGESIIATSMHALDVARLIAWPHSNVCSDGALAGRHPRGFGAFPRVLAQHVRQESWLTLEEGVHKMTSLAAAHMGIADRGTIRTGAVADLVLFDPITVRDRATPTAPNVTAVGIERVWVSGVEVYASGAPTGARPGRVIRRAGIG